MKSLTILCDADDTIQELTTHWLAETLIFSKYGEGLKERFPSIKCIVFNDFAEYKDNIKYELLQSLKRNNKSESYSNSLTQAIMILFAIRKNHL